MYVTFTHKCLISEGSKMAQGTQTRVYKMEEYFQDKFLPTGIGGGDELVEMKTYCDPSK